MAKHAVDVQRIVGYWLQKSGFDGLVSCDRGCGCALGDLAPCGSFPGDCEPAFKHYDTRPGKNPEMWAMFSQKEAPSAAQWEMVGG